MASFVGKMNMGGPDLPIAATLYGTCDTAAGTMEKAVDCPNFDTFITGMTIHVKFTYGCEVDAPTLNINGIGAKPICDYGDGIVSGNDVSAWPAGAMVSFTYDGTNWVMDNKQKVPTTNSVSSSSNDLVTSYGIYNALLNKTDVTAIAYPELAFSSKASRSYKINDYIYFKNSGQVFRVISAISSGGTFAEMSNVWPVGSIGNELTKTQNNIYSSLSQAYTSLTGYSYSTSASWSMVEGTEFYTTD